MAKYIIAALAGIAAGVIVMAYTPPEGNPHLEPDRPVPREGGLRVRVTALIRGLRSPDPKARSIFHRNLVEETGMFFGFKPADLPEEREAALGRWEEWWAANRDKTKEQWLTDSLSLENYEGKPLALKKLAEMSSQASIPAIIAALDDPQSQLRIDAAQALGKLKARDAVGRLIALLEGDEEVRVRRAAARSLGHIASKEALLALAQTATQEDALTRIEAACALMLYAGADSPELALPVLHSLLADGDREAKLFAASRLAQLCMRESVPHLAALLGQQEDLAKKAREALTKIAGKDLGSDPAPWQKWYKTQQLIDLLKSENGRQLGVYKKKGLDRQQAVPILIELLKDKDKEIRHAALQALKDIIRQDFGTDYEKWKKWYEQNKPQPDQDSE